MLTKQAVESFFGQQKWAFIGVSQDKKKFGHFAFKDLKTKGYEVYPINPNAQSIEGETVYSSLDQLPEKVGAAIISVSPAKTAQLVREAHAQDIRHIWIQQGAESKEALDYCEEHGMNCIHGECILMFAEPLGFPHNVHRFIWKLLGKLPK